MTKFILLYNGPATPSGEMSKEQIDKVMGGWDTWMKKAGDAIVDIGLPMDDQTAVSVVDDGSKGKAPDLNGYTIIQAENMDEAVKVVDGHPFLSEGSGKFSVDVFELLPMPGM